MGYILTSDRVPVCASLSFYMQKKLLTMTDDSAKVRIQFKGYSFKVFHLHNTPPTRNTLNSVVKQREYAYPVLSRRYVDIKDRSMLSSRR